MSGRLLDFGDPAQGRVLDAKAWEHESRIRRAYPERVAYGHVVCIYSLEPRVVGIRTNAGEELTIRVNGR